SAWARMPTSRPSSSTTGRRRTWWRAITRRASSRSWAGSTVTRFDEARSPIVVECGSFPSATTLIAMSRSVRTPVTRSPSTIGTRLAEQAVLLRSDGAVQDLRLPLSDGQKIQILTTRDSSDSDALAVLRHSSAHLLAEAVRRLYPGVKIAIGPPIENGFYYDFDFPEPIHEDDLARIEAEITRELEEGREWTREEVSADDAKSRFADEPYKLEL